MSLFAPITLGVFLPCYFGNEVSVSSAKLSTSLFHSDWTKFDAKTQKLMKIFMENSKQEMVIILFGLLKVNLEVFMNLLHSAYSLFAFFKSLGK